MKDEAWAALVEDPLVRGHLRRQWSGEGSPPIHTARQVIGEQRVCALLMRTQEADLLRDDPGHPGLRASDYIIQAVPYLWLHEIGNMARTMPIPRHTIGPDLFPFPVLWWTFEGALTLNEADTAKTLGLIDAVLIVSSGSWYAISTFGTEGDRFAGGRWGPLTTHVVRVGAIWPDDIPDVDKGNVGSVLAMMGFLDSPFIETKRDYPAARQHGKRRSQPSPEGVHFVRLRPSASAAVSGTSAPGTEWKVRWIVRGHLRAQWYPSTRSHRLIWIAPYVKGPEDAPMKTPAYAVVR